METQPLPLKDKELVVAVLVLVIVLVGGYLWYKSAYGPSAEPKKDFDVATAGGAKVAFGDVTSTARSKLPPGFPKEIPVEQDIVIESYRAVYEEYGFTQYAYTYVSERSFDSLWEEYADFFESSGYIIEAEDEEEGTLKGRKDNDELTVNIAVNNQRSFVSLNYVEK